MFEDSLFASKVGIRAARSRWATMAAVIVQGGVVGALLLGPMLHPLALPMLKTAPAVVSVNLQRPVKTEPVKVRTAASSGTALQASANTATPTVESRTSGRIIAPGTSDEPQPLVAMGGGMAPGAGLGIGSGIGVGSTAGPVVTVRSGAPVRISSGVSSGMLLGAIRPMYPAIARAAGVSGTVVITARIDKTGKIVGATVVSGPGMLRNAALEAVEAAHYRPYLLNGEAVEVETSVVVNFRLGG